jgi:hypothetical protein
MIFITSYIKCKGARRQRPGDPSWRSKLSIRAVLLVEKRLRLGKSFGGKLQLPE